MTIAMATTYGVTSVEKTFAVTPSISQELHDKIIESSAFLQLINVMPVDEIKGEKILGSATALIPKRTDTDLGDRQTTDALNLENKFYECYKSEYDVHIKYSTIDSWAKFPDFQQRYANWVRRAIALAKIRVGWYGITAEDVTDPVANPNGEDVNIGWLQHLRAYKSGAHWFSEGETVGEIRVGEGGDFANLDSAVHGALQMVDEIYRDGDDLIVLLGKDLLAEDKAQLYAAQGKTPTEKERIENQAVTRTYAGLAAITAPSFPARGLLVTSLDNLSIYYQDTSVRRKVEDNSKRDRIEDYNSINECYVVEDESKCAGFEFANVKLPDGSGWS